MSSRAGALPTSACITVAHASSGGCAVTDRQSRASPASITSPRRSINPSV
jgi:hypothetical protein